MPSVGHQIISPGPVARSFAVVALTCATLLASPLTAARADTVSNAAMQLAQGAAPKSPVGAGAASNKKADVAEYPEVFHHIGLLINGPPGLTEVPFS